jgi:hypothetical protein
MVKCGVLFEVRIESLNVIYTGFGFKGLNLNSVNQLILVMVKCGVLFEIRTEFFSTMQIAQWNPAQLLSLLHFLSLPSS